MVSKRSYQVHIDRLGHKYICIDKTYRLMSYGELKVDEPIGSLRETLQKVVVNQTPKSSWTEFSTDLKIRIDRCAGAELNLAAFDLQNINQENGFLKFSEDEELRKWLQSTETYKSL